MEDTDQVLEAQEERAEEESAPDPGAEDQIAESEEIVIADAVAEEAPAAEATVALKAVIEAAIYITDEPLTAEQIASALEQPLDKVKEILAAPEILEVRGVQGAGVLKTLLDRKLIAAAGRKNVVGKPILYKTTREFLIQFGLNSLAELPTLKEFEELGRFALTEGEEPSAPEQARVGPAQEELKLDEPAEENA